MIFKGISGEFSIANDDQYNTIGAFWDEMSLIWGLENLRGLGYKWENGVIFYAIGLKSGDIPDYNLTIELPDKDWITVYGETDCLAQIYDEIYRSGRLKYEIESFTEDGKCEIKYYR